MKTAAVILAGGASRRMGTPKALLTYSGETFLDRLIGLFEPVCSDVIVVLGYSGDAVRSGIQRAATFVINPAPEHGQLSSLQCGLRELPPDTEAVFFTPVDYPGFRADTVAGLYALAGDGALAAVPQFEGKHGHPVLVRAELASEILSLTDGETARDVMHRHIDRTRYLPVDDRGILLDVDDPEAYRELIRVGT